MYDEHKRFYCLKDGNMQSVCHLGKGDHTHRCHMKLERDFRHTSSRLTKNSSRLSEGIFLGIINYNINA